MESIKVRIFTIDGSPIYEEFTKDDRFEIDICDFGLSFIVGVNGSGRHHIDFFQGIGPCKDKIRGFYEKLGVTEEKVKALSPHYWDEPKYFNLKPSYANTGY